MHGLWGAALELASATVGCGPLACARCGATHVTADAASADTAVWRPAVVPKLASQALPVLDRC